MKSVSYSVPHAEGQYRGDVRRRTDGKGLGSLHNLFRVLQEGERRRNFVLD